MKLSVVFAVRNEASTLGACLDSVKSIADEIIVVDDASNDNTSEVAKKYSAKVYDFKHKENFHEAKQYAIDKANGDWIFQLDADERVSPELANEISEVINLTNDERLKRVLVPPFTVYSSPFTKKASLFFRHQQLIEEREGKLGSPTGEVVAFFVPRINIFMGKPLIHGGVYPDGVIRLFKKGYAHLPAKSVHELMEVDGEVGWLVNDLEHHDSPTLARYLKRNTRYVEIMVQDFQKAKLPKNLLNLYLYTVHRPLVTFISLYVRHKAILDGWRGFVWSFFSALRFPRAYLLYWCSSKM